MNRPECSQPVRASCLLQYRHRASPVAVASALRRDFLGAPGACDLGGLLSHGPRSDLMTANYADMAAKMSQKAPPSTPAEWMLLGALRNTTNVWWQPSWRGNPDQELAGMSRPEESRRGSGARGSLPPWPTAAGGLRTRGSRTRRVSNLFPGTDNALLINANLLASIGQTKFNHTFILSSFPNHWITLLSEIVVDVTKNIVSSQSLDVGPAALGATGSPERLPRQLLRRGHDEPPRRGRLRASVRRLDPRGRQRLQNAPDRQVDRRRAGPRLRPARRF